MILGLHHTAIATADIERLVEFYVSLFGCRKLIDEAWDAEPAIDRIVGLPNSAARFVLLDAGNQCLEFFQYRSPETVPGDPDRPASDAGITHICFAVRDIDGEYARLSKAGMSFHVAPIDAGDRPFRATYGRDPDGNIIELIELLGDHPFNYSPTCPSWTPDRPYEEA